MASGPYADSSASSSKAHRYPQYWGERADGGGGDKDGERRAGLGNGLPRLHHTEILVPEVRDMTPGAFFCAWLPVSPQGVRPGEKS